jgi:hypothetical protein
MCPEYLDFFTLSDVVVVCGDQSLACIPEYKRIFFLKGQL